MTDLLNLAANHPWWFTLWLGMTYYTLIAIAANTFKRKAKE